jgi:hypothetical protein
MLYSIAFFLKNDVLEFLLCITANCIHNEKCGFLLEAVERPPHDTGGIKSNASTS